MSLDLNPFLEKIKKDDFCSQIRKEIIEAFEEVKDAVESNIEYISPTSYDEFIELTKNGGIFYLLTTVPITYQDSQYNLVGLCDVRPHSNGINYYAFNKMWQFLVDDTNTVTHFSSFSSFIQSKIPADASKLSIIDANSNFTSENVEGALAELSSQYKDIANQLEGLGQGGSSGSSYTFLQGKKYIATGDSIVDYQGTTLEPITYTGTDLQGTVHTDEVVKGYIQAIENRYGLICTNLGQAGHTIVSDYGTLASQDYSDVALVTIAYGVNDARTGVPLGTVNSTDATTFAGALNNLLRKIYTDNPECRVLVLTPLQRLFVSDFGIATQNANGNYLIDFVDMCKKVAEKRSTECIDMYRNCGINQTNLHYYTREGVHPLNTGYLRMTSPILQALDKMFIIEFNPFGTMTNSGDTEPEEPDTGGGTGGDTPIEDDKATVVDISSLFTNTGFIYDNWGGVNSRYDYIYTTPIELVNGKTYTIKTILATDLSYWGITNTSTDFTTHTSIKGGETSEEITIDGTVYKKVIITLVVPNNENTYYLWINKIKAVDISNCSLTYI